MRTKTKNISLKQILIGIGIGIWVIVLQNAGILPTKQNVYIKGGYVDADISNTVNVQGSVDVENTVDVQGSVDVNISQILGRPAGCRTSYTIDGQEYQSLDVSPR